LAAWASRPDQRAESREQTALTVAVHSDLAAVEGRWRELERSGVCSPYQRFDWISHYAATLSADQGAKTCVLSVQRPGGEPLLLLALSVQFRHGMRIASPMGGKQANYHCPLMAPGIAPALDARTMDGLLRDAGARAGIDIFVLHNLPLAWAGERNPLVLPGATPSPSNAPKAALPAQADAFLNGVGTSESRRKLRRKEAALEGLGKLVYCVARSREDVDGILDAFFRQKNERFRDLGIASPFDDDASRRFIETACLTGLAQGRPAIELHGLSLDGRFIATYGGAVDGRRFSCMFNSFDPTPETARFSPGDVLLMRLIRTQCDLGRSELDLGIGEARYKRLFCKDTEELVDVFLPVTVMGRLYGLALEQLVTGKRYVKQSPALWSSVKAMRAARSKLGI
jgi:CelD/BcsL family acetyltransferase involved in cellulose biosynthesis